MASDVTSSPSAAVSSFIFSPPLTRAKSRRISLTPAPSPSAMRGIGLLSTVDVRGLTTPTAGSPAKKLRGRPKRSDVIIPKVDTPINFIPELDDDDEEATASGDDAARDKTSGLRKPKMTLRTRAQQAPFQRKVKSRSIKK